MEAQETYFDGPARTKNADQIRAELASKAIALLGEAPKNSREKPSIVLPQGTPLGQAFKNLVRVEKEGNGGSSVVSELKYCVSRDGGGLLIRSEGWPGSHCSRSLAYRLLF